MRDTSTHSSTSRDTVTVHATLPTIQIEYDTPTIVIDIVENTPGSATTTTKKPPPAPTPTSTMIEVFDDLLFYTFSFLEGPDLISVGQVCKRWRDISSGNDVWKRELQLFLTNTNQKKRVEDLQASNFKKLFFKMKYAHTHLDDHHKRISRIRNCQIWTGIAMGIFIPLSLCFGFLYLSIISPLFMDGYINYSQDNVWLSSIPEWLLFFTPFIVFMCTITIVFLLFIPQRKYAKSVQLVQYFELHWDGYFEAAFISIWIVGWFLWIPLIFLGLYLRLLIVPFFVSTGFSYRLAFLPVHLYSVLYIGAPLYVMVQWSLLHKPLMKWSVGCYLVGVAINCFVSIQCGLISAKLDQSMDSYWSSIFSPLWILHGLLLMFPGVCCLEAVHPWKLRFIKIGGVMAIIEVFLFPVQIWLILFALRLDLFISISFTSTFIPLYVVIFVILSIGMAVCTCFSAKFIQPKVTNNV